jgi:hypothetical protein
VAHASYSDETHSGEAVREGSLAIKIVSMGDDVSRLNRVEFQCVALTTPMGTASFSSFLSFRKSRNRCHYNAVENLHNSETKFTITLLEILIYFIITKIN